MTGLRSQRGATLFVALILLVVLTLAGVSAFNMSSMNLRTSVNMQTRAEAQNAAQEAIDRALSTTQFLSTPDNVFTSACGGANSLCADKNGDGASDYTVRLNPAPTCRKAEAISMGALDLSQPADLPCAAGQSQQFGIAGIDVAAGNSLCSATIWEITAEATADVNEARVVVAQGVSVRVPRDAVFASCL